VLVISIKSLKSILNVYFVLITIHVIVVYTIKNIGGFSINDPQYIFIKMWKEIVLLLFIALYIYKYKEKKVLLINLDLLILLFVMIGVVYMIVAPNKLTAIWSFRSIFQIFAFYLLGRFFFFDLNELRVLFLLLVIMGVLTSIFAVYQVEVLGTDFFTEIYGVDEVAVAMTSYGYDNIRASSTFITPHEFGLFLVLCFLFSSYLIKTSQRGKLFFYLAMVILLIGLAYSLSRSSILLFVISFGLFWVRNSKTLILFVLISTIFILILFYLEALDNFISIVDGRDPSSQGHYAVLQDFISHLNKYPFGSGLGTVGVVVRRFIEDAPQFEGEIFNIFAMMSIIGGTLYIFILGYQYLNLLFFTKTTSKTVYEFINLLKIVILVLTFRELILPRDFTNYSLGWFLLGSGASYFKFNHSISSVKSK
jgi:hypothetical protein